MARVYRYHQSAEDQLPTKALVLAKRKRRSRKRHHLIAADETRITDESGTRPIEMFRKLSGRQFITRTRREADNIFLNNPGCPRPSVLEDDFQWLPKTPYVPDSQIGFEIIKDIFRSHESALIPAATYCDEKWNTVCNAIRKKNSLDARFQFAWHLPIQDVFLLEERREDRCVIAIDVNAMYSACMQQRFPRPSALRHVEIDRDYCADENLEVGLYRCLVSDPKTEFIKTHNPFRTFFCGKRLQASLDEPIEIDLNEFEIAYYSRHFEQIYMVDAVISNHAIRHPLAREARRSYARRQSYLEGGNRALADREKFLATLLSSCTSRPTRSTKTFENFDDAVSFLTKLYGIAPPADEPRVATESWLQRNNGAKVVFNDKGISTKTSNSEDGSSCFVFGQRVVAEGRIRLLKLMEQVLTMGSGIEVCYVNVDSVHFSVPISILDDVTRRLQTLASDAMGGVKIESLTSCGLWLEPGRYWLYSHAVEKFKNRGVGNRRNPFQDQSTYILSRKIDDLHIPIPLRIRMEKSMSDVRGLETHMSGDASVVKQRMISVTDLSTFSDILTQLSQNRKSSTPRRLAAFRELGWRLDHSCPAASGQE